MSTTTTVFKVGDRVRHVDSGRTGHVTGEALGGINVQFEGDDFVCPFARNARFELLEAVETSAPICATAPTAPFVPFPTSTVAHALPTIERILEQGLVRLAAELEGIGDELAGTLAAVFVTDLERATGAAGELLHVVRRMRARIGLAAGSGGRACEFELSELAALDRAIASAEAALPHPRRS